MLGSISVRGRAMSLRRVATAATLLGVLVAIAGPSGQRAAVASSLGGGALVAAVALGVVLTQRSSGVVNFASAATATYGAYTYADLRRTGRLFVPPLPNPLALIEGIGHRMGATGLRLPHWPTELSLGGPVGVGTAFALSLVVATALGLAVHALVFHPLRGAPPLAKTVASVGLLLVLQAIVELRFTSQTMAVQPILAKRPVHLLGTVFTTDQLVVAAVVIAVTAGLAVLFRATRFGMATRAAAESEKAAVLIGLSPDRLAAANWVLSTVLAASFGILAATVNASIDPASITLLVIPAVGAALVGGLSSFTVTVAAAFAIAGLQSVIQFLAATASWFPRADGAPLPGVREAIPFLLIVGVLFVRGERLPTRGSAAGARLPLAPVPTQVAAKALACAGLGAVALLIVGPSWRLAAINSLVGVVICLSLVVLTGFVGQISLAQMAFAGIGGFTVSKLAIDHGVGFPVAPLLGALVAMLVGVIAAIPALRVRGVNLAVVTLAAAATVQNLVFRNSALSGGIRGAPVPPPRLLGVRLGPNDPTWLGDGKLPSPLFGILCLVVAVGVGVLVANLRRSATGRQLLAVRTNERAAAGGGIDVARAKLVAFAFSSAVAGLGGALSAYRFGSVEAATFGTFASISFLAFAYLGGISSISGAIAGGVFVANGLAFTALHSWFGLDGLTNLIGGVGLIVTAIFHPEGLASSVTGAARRATALIAYRRPRRVLAMTLRPEDTAYPTTEGAA